ncbi:MAG TPA: erythromycin esterase family protein [Lacunisphaera sp.]|nr:erythromycin esterase family protein [Lacunisphaera sp.]
MARLHKEHPEAVAALRDAAIPLADHRAHEPIASAIGDAPLVLLGEATHGTHDFYALRAQVTRALIERHGFTAVAIEGDWPDAWRVNRFVQHTGPDTHAVPALNGFARFPTWMWRNTAVADFIGWLRAHNAAVRAPGQRVGFYGLDLYSLHASMRAVVAYLEERDPAAAAAARHSYACFDQYGPEADTYGWATTRLGHATCEEAVARELVALHERRTALVRGDGVHADDEFFFAEQNARVARNAEQYYRSMFRGRVASWNLRDEHMVETLQELMAHLRRRGQAPKVIVWAHNSHVGDARATDMGREGELNLGQLVRERITPEARLIGFTTHAGTVIAASDWGGEPELKQVRPALPDSVEALFHQTGVPRFFLPLRHGSPAYRVLAEPRLERAIGVVYRPDTERLSHCFNARVAEQFDAIIHLDETGAVDPLPGQLVRDTTEVPETYPSGV